MRMVVGLDKKWLLGLDKIAGCMLVCQYLCQLKTRFTNLKSDTVLEARVARRQRMRRRSFLYESLQCSTTTPALGKAANLFDIIVTP